MAEVPDKLSDVPAAVPGAAAARKGCWPQGLLEVESSWHHREERFHVAIFFSY